MQIYGVTKQLAQSIFNSNILKKFNFMPKKLERTQNLQNVSLSC